MPSITLNLNVENAPNPARKHIKKTNSLIRDACVHSQKFAKFPAHDFSKRVWFQAYGRNLEQRLLRFFCAHHT